MLEAATAGPIHGVTSADLDSLLMSCGVDELPAPAVIA
jgi:hypothetical protein